MDTKVKEEFLIGAVVGGIIGATTALLFTPVKGSIVRKQVKNGLSIFGNGHNRPLHHPVKRKPAHARTKKAAGGVSHKKTH